MAALIVSIALALFSGSLVYLSAPTRRMARIKRLGETHSAVPDGPEREWVRRRIIAETRLLRRESSPWRLSERVAAYFSSAFVLVAVVVAVSAATDSELPSGAQFAAWMTLGGLTFFVLVPLLALRYYRMSVWRSDDVPPAWIAPFPPFLVWRRLKPHLAKALAWWREAARDRNHRRPPV